MDPDETDELFEGWNGLEWTDYERVPRFPEGWWFVPAVLIGISAVAAFLWIAEGMAEK